MVMVIGLITAIVLMALGLLAASSSIITQRRPGAQSYTWARPTTSAESRRRSIGTRANGFASGFCEACKTNG
jgi:hypothetical protein